MYILGPFFVRFVFLLQICASKDVIYRHSSMRYNNVFAFTGDSG